MRIARRTTAVVFALAVLGSCSGDDNGSNARADEPVAASAAAGSNAVVTIHTFNFQPDPITVKAGTKIMFHNDDKILHTVTSGTRDAPTPDVFNSKLDGAGSSFTLTLDKPGTYPYFCMIHPGEGMTGKIIVR
jgi:plastocyanin